MARDRFLPPGVDASTVVARVGLVSDTHMPERCAELPPSLFDVLAGVDLLLHAGDVGELWVLERLSAIAPVVYGRDGERWARFLAERQHVVAACAKWYEGRPVGAMQMGKIGAQLAWSLATGG